jgi:serine/threonine protein kinase
MPLTIGSRLGSYDIVAPADTDPTEAATFERQTDPGTVLGTSGYMSPEQVRGEPGDHRSDLFSFGIVLYEMVAGHRAFRRPTSPETMLAILRDDPPEIAPEVAVTMPASLRASSDRAVHLARWFGDGTRLLVCGAEADHSQRCYVQDANGGAPKPVTPLGTHSGSVSPDGTTLLVRSGGGTARSMTSSASLDAKFELYPIGGGAPTPVAGLTSDVPGALNTGGLTISDDLNVYAYYINQELSRLFLITGAR